MPASDASSSKLELMWPGKYDKTGQRQEVRRVGLPFQVIETSNKSRATREAAKEPKTLSLFDVWEAKEGASAFSISFISSGVGWGSAGAPGS